MYDLIILSLKNLGRDRKRTAVRLLGLSTVTAALIIWGSITNGFSKSLFEVSTSLDSGIYQVYAKDYFDSEDFYKYLRKEVHTENFKDLGFPYSSRKYRPCFRRL